MMSSSYCCTVQVSPFLSTLKKILLEFPHLLTFVCTPEFLLHLFLHLFVQPFDICILLLGHLCFGLSQSSIKLALV